MNAQINRRAHSHAIAHTVAPRGAFFLFFRFISGLILPLLIMCLTRSEYALHFPASSARQMMYWLVVAIGAGAAMSQVRFLFSRAEGGDV